MTKALYARNPPALPVRRVGTTSTSLQTEPMRRQDIRVDKLDYTLSWVPIPHVRFVATAFASRNYTACNSRWLLPTQLQQ